MSSADEIEVPVPPAAPLTTLERVEDDIEIEPTAEELATLEHVADNIPYTVWLIVICEFCERCAFIGLSGPFKITFNSLFRDPMISSQVLLDAVAAWPV